MAMEMLGYAKWWLKSLFGSKAPLVNTLIIHYGCNLRCKHCSIHSSGAEHQGKNKLSYDEIVNDLKLQFKNGARIAYFEGGETTLWEDGGKDLGDLIKAAKDAGYKNVGYTTNGTNRLFTGSDIISVSLDGPRDVHDEIRGDGVYDKLMDNITNTDFTGAIYANMVINKHNMNSIEDTVKVVKDNEKLSGIIFNFITPPPHDIALTKEEKEKAIAEIRELKKNGYPILNSKKGLGLLAEEDWSRKCPYYVTVFIVPDGSHHNGCPMHDTPSCKECGFAAVREYYLIKRGNPFTITEMSSIFAMSKK